MPWYLTVTPLRHGGPEPVPAGEVVELDEGDGDALVRLRAARQAGAPEDVPPPAPATSPPAAPAPAAGTVTRPLALPAPKPLDRQNRSELLATAAAAGVEVAADASKAVIKAAIEARTPAA